MREATSWTRKKIIIVLIQDLKKSTVITSKNNRCLEEGNEICIGLEESLYNFLRKKTI